MADVVIQPMQWALVKDLSDCEPLGQQDLDCMREVRAVLERHGKLRRFALHLIHKHFPLGPSEILVEYSDPDLREQVCRVESAESESARTAVPTTWSLEQIEPTSFCKCAYRMNKGHLGRHETGIADEEAIPIASA